MFTSCFGLCEEERVSHTVLIYGIRRIYTVYGVYIRIYGVYDFEIYGEEHPYICMFIFTCSSCAKRSDSIDRRLSWRVRLAFDHKRSQPSAAAVAAHTRITTSRSRFGLLRTESGTVSCQNARGWSLLVTVLNMSSVMYSLSGPASGCTYTHACEKCAIDDDTFHRSQTTSHPGHEGCE
jgi:hypothetical protein